MKNRQDENKKKINVLQCRIAIATGGGPEKTILLIGEKADPDKFNIIIVYLRGAEDKEFQIGNWAREKGLTIHEIAEHSRFSVSTLRKIHQVIQQYQIDIFHARDYKSAVIGYILSFLNPRMKLIFTAHLWQDLDSLKMKFYTWLNLKVLPRYHKIVAVSEALKQFMIDRGIDGRKITVIHNAIDVDTWKRENVTSTIREEFHIPSTSKIMGVVERLNYEKDLPTTLKVAEKVIQALPDTYFLIVGDGPDREMLERQVQQMGLSDKILLLGFRKDTLNVYAALDVFVSTALTEGTPNTALEALAMEVPVVYTNVGGVGEVIQDGYDGLLFQPGDVEGISQAVISILTDEENAKKLREHGRQTVCTKYSFTNRLKALEAIYEELVQV